MYNWSTDTTELQKDPIKYAIWKLEQMVNFGLQGEKLSKKLLEKFWQNLNLDPHKKQYLEFLLWNKKAS